MQPTAVFCYLADGTNIIEKSLINCIFGRRNADEQLNKTCTLGFKSAFVLG